jgi:hypothetical protein
MLHDTDTSSMTAKITTNKRTGRRRFQIFERRSLQLTLEQWQALEQLAEDLGVRSEGGERIGTPSWRTMVRLVAVGALRVVWMVAGRNGDGKAGS